MIQALAPRMPRGCSWVCLSIWLATVLTSPSLAQSSPRPGAAAAASPAAGAKLEAKPRPPAGASKDAKKAAEDLPKGAGDKEAPEKGAEKGAGPEVFKDPNVEAILEKKYRQLPGVSPQEGVRKQVRAMAANQLALDRDMVTKYVSGLAADLTNPSYLRALTDPPPACLPTAPRPAASRMRARR